MKKLLVSVIRRLIVNTGVQTLVIVVVKIVGDAGLGIGQVGKNGPLADLEDLRFEAGPETFGLGIIVAVATTALRTQRFVVVEQGPIRVAAVLPALPGTTAVGVHKQARRGRLGPKSPL